MHITLQRLHDEFGSLLESVDAARMQLRTGDDPNRWNVQQIVEHLLLTYTATSENYRQRLEKGSATRSRVTMQARVGQFVVCTLGVFPKGRIAPTMVEPDRTCAPVSGDGMLRRVSAELGRLDELAHRAERVFGNRRAVPHPVLGPMSVKNWRLFHLRHGEHHLRQIAAILGPTKPNHKAGRRVRRSNRQVEGVFQSAANSSASTSSTTGR